MVSIIEKCDESRRRLFKAGAVLLEEGKRTGRLHVLASGQVEVLRGDTQVAVIGDVGAVFGEMSILLDTPHTATVRALSDCETYFYEDAAGFMRSDPEITFGVAALLAQRLNSATTYLVDLKRQYAGAGSGLAMVSDVLASLVNQPARDYEPGSDRETDLISPSR
ncbi:MAG: cyclic nucleotide-binding domain-containing protein [Proteobacteria bacterium]|nr:cyclic nucleotide-binding domain-containing protein [Pseudomonadota bacterium]